MGDEEKLAGGLFSREPGQVQAGKQYPVKAFPSCKRNTRLVVRRESWDVGRKITVKTISSKITILWSVKLATEKVGFPPVSFFTAG
jgi:hypothetical protein